tara:strand:+ start:41 stop:445 length:405 start_codon:yes stop_codon:yes gene_type:complete
MNIGVFGVGSFGEKHINVLKNIKNFKIIGFYDPNETRSKEIEKQFQIQHYKNPDSLIKKCHAIDIVSETSTHYAIIEKVIKYNKHIFVEKPIKKRYIFFIIVVFSLNFIFIIELITPENTMRTTEVILYFYANI